MIRFVNDTEIILQTSMTLSSIILISIRNTLITRGGAWNIAKLQYISFVNVEYKTVFKFYIHNQISEHYKHTLQVQVYTCKKVSCNVVNKAQKSRN